MKRSDGGRRYLLVVQVRGTFVAELLSCREIWTGFIGIDEILMYVRYSMRLEIEYDGQPDTVTIEIVQGPRKEFEEEIPSHLKEQFDDYVLNRLQCPHHGDLLPPSCPSDMAPRRTEPAPGRDPVVLNGRTKH